MQTLKSHIKSLNVRINPEQDAESQLPILHRIAIIYLVLPLIIWLIGWFEWWFGITLSALIIFALAPILSGSWHVSSPRITTYILLIVALGWVMLTSAGGIFDEKILNWVDHETVILDVGRNWPPFLPDILSSYRPIDSAVSDTPPHLRFYLGWHMVPALIAQLISPAVALNWAIPIWTWIGVALMLLLFTREFKGWSIAIAATILILFSGMDFLRTIILEGWEWIDPRIDYRGWPGINLGKIHIEWDGRWDVKTQYSSNTTALMWVPHHFIPAGIYTMLILQLRRNSRFIATSAVLIAIAPFWSIFVALGLLPLVAILLRENGIRPFLRWQSILPSIIITALLALYLTSGKVDFYNGWIWQRYEWQLLIRWIPLFLLHEFLILSALLWWVNPKLRREPFFIVSVAVLLILPIYFFSYPNDLVMRSSLPALHLICFFTALAITRYISNAAHRGTPYHRLAMSGLVLILAIGSLTPIIEITRATNNDVPFRRSQRIDYTTLTDMPVTWKSENTAYELPYILQWVLQDPNPSIAQTHEKPEPLVRSNYDIYLQDDKIIYVKDYCNNEDAKKLFLHVISTDIPDQRAPTHGALPADQFGFAYIDQFIHKEKQWCGAVRRLPQYEIATIRTGQRLNDENAWEVEIALDGNQQPARATVRDYQAEYDAATSSTPVISSQFDIYINNNQLTYIKQPCIDADIEAGFFLQTISADAFYEPPSDRHTIKFDNLDFDFQERGIIFNDICLATVTLPDYGAAFIKTGQWTVDEGAIWQGEYNTSTPQILDTVQQLQQSGHQPVIKSNFDVYLHENKLIYFKSACTDEEINSRFFLHIYPTNSDDLPRDRQELGFNNFNFSLLEQGGLLRGNCIAAIQLPAYAIDVIDTGQFTPDGQTWQAELIISEN